jgi:D-alanyl-D-alanine carboxypeptidase (penicillin-binding protein 5/6)
MTTSPDGLAGLDELWSRDPADSVDEVDPGRRRRRRRWGLIAALIVLVIVIGTPTAYVGWALNAPVASPTVTSQTPTAPAGAPAAILLLRDGAAAISVSGGEEYLGPDTGGVWLTSGTDEVRPMASISKLITALVVLEAWPLDGTDVGPTLTFDEADNDLYDEYYVRGATIAAMPTGSEMSLRDALATMLIPSASNYAEVVSTWAFGSQGAFVSAARRWLAANGLDSTTLVEPTGLDRRNASTPTDLLALGKIAAANPVIAKIAATPAITLGGAGTVRNTNGLIGTAGITGLKTGNLGEGTYNLLYTASLDVGAAAPLSVTGVALGGYSSAAINESVVATLESLRSGFHTVPVATAGEQVGSLTTAWGSSARMVIAEDASIFTWSDTPITVAMNTTAPVTYEDGEVVGTVTWTAGPHTATAPVTIQGEIEPPSEWWRLTHPDELG